MADIIIKHNDSDEKNNENLHEENLQLTKNLFQYKETYISAGLFLVGFSLSFFATSFNPIGAFILSSLSLLSLGFGTSYLASIIFTKRYEAVVGKRQTKLLSAEIAEDLKIKLNEVNQKTSDSLTKVESLFGSHITELEKRYCSEIYKNLGEYLPRKRFPRSNTPNPEYNEILTNAFLETNNYRFRGTQGIYIPIRLESLSKKKGDIKNLNIKILLFDPRDDIALSEHAKEVYKDEKISDIEKLKSLKESIFQAIVGLYDVSTLTSIELKLYRDSIFYRSEIFDKSVFITFYNQRQTFDSFPPSYQYEKHNIYYDIFDRDFKQTWDIVKERMDFTSIGENEVEKENKLKEFLENLGCEKSIEQLRRTYDLRKKEKIEQLKAS